MSGTLRAVIVDWAGTIVDFGSCAPARSFVELFARNGVPITEAQARGPMGQGKRDHIRSLARLDDVSRRWTERHGQPCGEQDIDRMYAEFVPLQIEAIAARADVIPGAPEAVTAFRARGLGVGSTTGYSREMVEGLELRARDQGLFLDNVITASDVPRGRPAPWMALLSAQKLDAYPLSAVVKIGDTVADIDEGLNAGMWTIAVCATGNEMALDAAELQALSPAERSRRLSLIRGKLLAAGAHFVVDGIADAHAALDEIESRLAQGDRP